MSRCRRRNRFKRTIQAPVSLQISATHGSCVHFLPLDRCSLKGIEVDPRGAACKDFSPKSPDLSGAIEG